jgi:hypothetical protein
MSEKTYAEPTDFLPPGMRQVVRTLDGATNKINASRARSRVTGDEIEQLKKQTQAVLNKIERRLSK